MNGRLKTIGLLLSPLIIGLSSAQQALAVDEGAENYCHGATDFIGCMKAEREGSAEELRAIRSEIKSANPPVVWLVLRFGQVSGASLLKVPTKDMNECEMQGAIWTGSKRLYPSGDYRGFECLEGIR